MSTIYNTEPQPTASVILHTTSGDLSVELFAKQTPLTSRNFLQHCLDGYYDNTIFHRLVPGFIIQGGDPTGTGSGGESIYDGGALSGDLDPWPMDQRKGKNAGPTGANFKDEFHSRLKFNRRGLLGMANEGLLDSNGSQFFFTLGKTSELDGKNTVFGRIAGDTIYNLAKIGEAEIGEGGERPLYPTKITSTEILVNPFDDMEKRERIAQRTETKTVAEKKPKKRKVGSKQLLSFGDEEGDDEVPVIKKAKFDTRIVMDDGSQDAEEMKPKKPSSVKKEEKAAVQKTVTIRESLAKMAPRDRPSEPESSETVKRHGTNDLSSPEPDVPTKTKSALEKANEEIAALKASMKRTIQTAPVRETKKSAIEQMIPETSRKGKKRRPGGNEEDPEAMSRLKAFQARLDQTPASKEAAGPSVSQNGEEAKSTGGGETGGGEEDEVCDLHFIANCQSCRAWDKYEEKDESGDEGWIGHSLSFAADKLGKDLNYRKKAEEELVVIDPREKAQTLKEAKRAEREARSGGSGRAWDQARLAKLSMAAATAGRGAK